MKAAVSVMTVVCAVTTSAWQAPARPLAIDHFTTATASITVTSHSFDANKAIPMRHADYGEKISPQLSWRGGPPAAKSFVVLAEDPDAREAKPFVHWVLFNLPPSFAMLPEAIPGTPRLPEFGGALQGRNSRGTTGYFGPRPPGADPAHHYHFQVFALDTMLNLDPGASATAVIAAMTGHVVARGEVVGLYRAPVRQP